MCRALVARGIFLAQDRTDIQFAVISFDPETGDLIRIVDNAAKAEVKGFELDVVAVPAPGLTLTASIGLTDAQYTETDPTSPVTTDSRFVKTPKWTVALSGQYAAPVGNWGELIGRLDYVYKTNIYHEVSNSPISLQDDYGLLNARLTFEVASGNWAVSVFATNLTDERYILGTGDAAGIGFAEVQYASPREWGASLKYNF